MSEDEPRPPAARMPTVIWIHDGPVCVSVVDELPRAVTATYCRCQACGASRHGESAEHFPK